VTLNKAPPLTSVAPRTPTAFTKPTTVLIKRSVGDYQPASRSHYLGPSFYPLGLTGGPICNSRSS